MENQKSKGVVEVLLALLGLIVNAVIVDYAGIAGVWLSAISISLLTLVGLYTSESKKDIVQITLICTLVWGVFLLISGWGGNFAFEPDDNSLRVYEFEGWYHWWPYLLPLLTVGIASLVSKK